MNETLSGFQGHDLGTGHKLWVGSLPNALMLTATQFETLWQMHPEKFHEIEMYGRLVETPRWQQAYGTDYHYTGRANRALLIPPFLEPFIRWSRDNINPDLNGLLLNWYDGSLGHYIGRHRDSIQNMIPGAPIVTISLGEERAFRLRPWPASLKGKPLDFPAHNGTVFVMPWETNRAFTHEVPASANQTGRRISITLRGFTNSPLDFVAQ
jgi:alkylated DNA repair dioxygenase AlkB